MLDSWLTMEFGEGVRCWLFAAFTRDADDTGSTHIATICGAHFTLQCCTRV